MPKRTRHSVARYGLAALAVGAALVVKVLIAREWAVEAPFLLFLGAVLFAAWSGGVGPGLAATALAALASDFFFLPPVGRVLAGGPDPRLVQFLLEGVFISVLSGLRLGSSEEAHRRAGELRVTLRSIGDAVVTADAEGRITFLNPVAQELAGWPAAEAVGRPTAVVLQLVHEGTRRRVECPIARVLRTGKSAGLSGHAVLVGRDGAGRPVDDTADPIHDSDGRLIGVVAVFRDTTERRRAEAARAETYRRTTAILESIGDAFYALDRDWRYTYVNAHAERYFGRPKEELLGRVVWDVYPEVRGTAFDAEYRRAVEGGTSVRFEVLSPVTGRWVEVSAYPSEEGLAVYFRDVTDRRAAEEERRRLVARLEAEEDRLRTILEQMPAGVLVAEAPACRVVLSNAQADELLGGLPARLRARTDYDDWVAYHPDGTPLTPDELSLLRALGGETVQAAEFWYPAPAGRDRWLRENATPIRDRGGEVTAAVLVLDDVTREKEAERALRWSHDVLESRLATISEEERRRISRELHDETGQQIAALILGLRSLRDRLGADGPAAALKGLQEQAEQVGRVLHRVAHELRPAVLDELGLETALQDAVRRWSERAGVPAQFHGTLGTDRLPPEVETHAYRMATEAMTNALKHAAATRLSVILDHRPGDGLTVIVEDDGRGFDPESAGNGDGRLGLRGMRERAALVGGVVEFESSPGAGTTVFVRVPLAEHGGGKT